MDIIFDHVDGGVLHLFLILFNSPDFVHSIFEVVIAQKYVILIINEIDVKRGADCVFILVEQDTAGDPVDDVEVQIGGVIACHHGDVRIVNILVEHLIVIIQSYR